MNNDSPQWREQRSLWVRDITRLMTIVITITALVILAGTLAGYFEFTETIPIYIALLLSCLAWLGAGRGGWQWACYFPVFVCMSLGIAGSIIQGFVSTFLLFYGLAVLLAGMLVNIRASFFTMLTSLVCYSVFGAISEGLSLSKLPSMVMFYSLIIGIYVLQQYFQSRLKYVFQTQAAALESLTAEIARREKAEAAQHQQEMQLRRLAENTSELISEVDAEGIIRYASPSYKTLLGYDPETLIGSSGLDIVHPDDIDAVLAVSNQSATSRKISRAQVRVRCADGHFIFIEASGTPLFNENGENTGHVFFARDIDAQKQAEKAIEESEEKFRAIIESLPMGIHMYSLEDDGKLVFTGYNPAADTILGIDHSTLVGKSIEQAFPGLIGTNVPDAYREVARTGIPWHNQQVDYEEEGISGAFDVTTFRTTPGHTVTIFSDITERIRAAEELRLSEEKFSMAFKISPDSVNINRLSDGVYIDINEGFTNITGYTLEDVKGKSSLDLGIWVNPADRERLVKGLQENGVVHNLEATFRRKDGSTLTGLMSARLVTVQGEPCLLNITRDLSERIQAEITLRKNEAELREAHHLLQQAYDATLQGWARALELRERETASHSRRVVELTMQVARAMGINGEELVHVERGALLHDIGKMGIPDGILLKPGRLTDDEWVIMRKHTEYAQTMLYEIEYLRPCLDIPYCHHEHWDGSGYPQGLKETEIPLPARIFAVVDNYDALTHNRPYRPAWSHAEAKLYLRNQCGKIFDPQVVETFLKFV